MLRWSRRRGLSLVVMVVAPLAPAGALRADARAQGAPAGPELLLDPPEVYGDDIWFPDERVPLAVAVAELLARPELGGYRVRPVRELRAFWSDAQAGRLPGVREICEAAPPPAWLARHVHRGASVAEIRVDCPTAQPACALQIVVESPRPTAEDPQHVEQTAWFGAQLRRGEPPSRWAEQLRAGGLRRTKAPPPRGGLGLSGLGGRAPDKPRVELRDLHMSGTWPAPLSAARLAPETAALDACTKPGQVWRDSWQQPYMIEVDTAGRIGRCEFTYIDHLPRPEFACVCGVLRGVRLEPGAAPRRATFDLVVVRPPPRARGGLEHNVYLDVQRASDDSATLGSHAIDDAALDACLAPLTSPVPETEVPVHLEVGADGRVTGHAAKWPRAIPARVRGCLDGVLAKGRFNCPLTGGASVDARLHVYVWSTR